MQRTKDGTVRNRGILRDRDEIMQELIKNPLIVVQYLDKFLDIKLITIISDTKFAF
jgi:hypothetical protein